MQTYRHEGDTIDIVSPAGGTNRGLPVLIGALFGVAMNDSNPGDTVAIVREGVFADQPKAAGTAWALGDPLYWDATALNFTKTANNNTRVGLAGDAAQAGDVTGTVIIDRRVG
ncbi:MULTISPECIES: DUF2190 family protein [unclassified Bradyrhizobium]|uniref:DUF2190 family protein n=1 Tax=unclassified Bradyrhizobium TaxID=2631580 RepID=UPI00291641BF|nr:MULTISPECIES: DUF2190 family protein [unclassified Bradyrhizobium]